MSKKTPSVVLVGRPNVGKSTLFNRLTGTRRSIVTAIPGTTRDVITYPVEWQGSHFDLTDTGGMFGASQDPLHALVLERGRRAIEDADLLVLVVDGREGLVPGDHDITKVVRDADKPALLAVNKTDDRRSRGGVLELYELGFDPVFEIAAEHAPASAISSMRSSSDCPRAVTTLRRCRSWGWRSWAGPTPGSRRWSIGCFAKNA